MRRRDVLLAGGVFLLALLARTLPFRAAVFRPGAIYPGGDGDVLYHLRRIEALAHGWPALADFDAWMAHPHGAYSIWSPLFDYVPGGFARLTGAPADLVGVWWPALLGAATAVPLFFFARRVLGDSAALVTAAVFTLLPGAVLIGALGRVDHHVAEVLFQVLIAASLARCLAQLERGDALDARPALLLGLCMGAALLTWAGALLFLVVPAAVLSLAVMLPPEGRAAQLARLGARAFVACALLAAPYALLNLARGREPFASHFLSLLQPSLCLVLAAAPPLCLWLARGLREGGTGRLLRRLLAPLGLAGALLLVPGIGPGLRAGLAFVTREQSPWLSEIAEFQPLLSGDASLTMATASAGYTLLLLPPVALVSAVAWWRGERSLPQLVLLVWAVHATALSFFQIRFVAYAAPLVAMVPGGLLTALAARGRSVALSATAVALLSLGPALSFWAPLAGPAPARVAYPQIRAEVYRFLRAVGQVTPAPGDPAELTRRGDYCIFAPWDLGHGLLAIAGRPVVANEYGTHLRGGGYDDSLRFYREAQDEAAALALLDRRGCRYLVTQAFVEGAQLGPFARRLHEGDGSDGDAGAGAGSLRLVLEAADLRVGGHPGYKLFERVAGAPVQVPAAVEPVTLRATIRSPTRTFEYRRVLAPASARREARLAHPGEYRVTVGARHLGTLRITARAVQRGEAIEIPLP